MLGTIKETVTTQNGSSLSIVVGITNSRSPDLQVDPRIEYWSQRMSADPNVVRYNPEVRVY